MRSEVDICNLALNHIAQNTITSLNEASNPARKCKLYFPVAKDAVLRAHDWNFATKIELLALIADETIPGWDYLYARPANCLYIRKIYNEANIGNALPTQYKEIKTTNGSRAIACDIDQAYIEFTQTVTDPNDFDSNFVEALSFKLAAMIAKSLTGDLALAEKMEQKSMLIVSDARRVNSSERNNQDDPYNGYVEARA